MWVLAGIFTLTLIKVSLAGRANYLGGDIETYAELSKKSTLYPRSNKPITSKQLDDYKKYQSKFSDIAKAYSEGYKAAIQAVQARAVIAQKRLSAYKKSKVPKPKGNVLDVIGTEKSVIPHPSQYLAVNKRSTEETKLKENGFHRETPSIMLSKERRAEISRLNAAALHRNVFMDNTGGLSYGGMGGVLSRQGWRYEKKHRRNVPEFILRQRRSHMPYLGQNLEQLGVIRVKPNWDVKPEKKNKVPEIRTQMLGEKASPKANIFGKQVNPFPRNNIAQMQPWQQEPLQQKSNVPSFNPYYGQQQMMYPNPYAAFMFPPQQRPMMNSIMGNLPNTLNAKTK